MKKLLFAVFSLVLAQSLFAVNPVPYALGVSFSFRISGVGNGIMTVYDESGSPSVAQTTYSTTTESPISTSWLKPGKEYTVNFQASGPYEYWLSFVTPEGYQLFIEGVPSDLYYKYTGGGGYSDTYHLVLRPIMGGGRLDAGVFSGINLGKAVSWDVGLGGLRSGHTVGLVSFREQDLSNSPASRDRLIFSAPINTLQCTVVRSGTGLALQQIGTPQATLDFVDDGSGYWINFYQPIVHSTWTGSVYTFTGSPWRQIHVESPSANQLKITETEGSVSRVSLLALTSGSVPSGSYVWTLQEGDGTTCLRTTTHTSTYNSDGTRDDIAAVLTGTGGSPVSKTKFHYSCPGALNTGSTNTISYNSSTCPLTTTPGATVSFTCNVTNTGTNTWGSNHYVALRDASYTNLSFASTTGVAPAGSITTSALSFTAPSTPGVYTYYLQGLENGVVWFSTTATLTLTVKNSGSSGTTDTATYNTTEFPLAVMPGVGLSFNSNVTNTGTNTWGSNHWLALRDGSYTNLAFASLSGIAPGGSTTVSLPLAAPTTPGVYTYYLHGLNNGVVWFPTLAPVSLTVMGNGWGEEVTQIVEDPDTAVLTKTFVYYTDPNYPGNYRRVKSITDATGNWTGFTYYDDWDHRGQVQYEYHPYHDTPSTAASASTTTGRVVYLEYAADWSGRYNRPSLRQEKVNNVMTAQKTWSYDNSSNYPNWPRDKADVASYRDASNYHSDRVETIQTTSTEEGGEPALMKGANLVQTTWNRMGGDYVSGVFTYAPNGSNWRELVVHGSTSSSGATSESSYDSQSFDATYVIANQSTMDVSIRDVAGNIIRKEFRVYTGSSTWPLVSYTDYTYNSAGRLTQSVGSNTATTDYTITNGLLMSTKDPAGNETGFTYDALWRVATSVKVCPSGSGYAVPGSDITTTYTYDGADHIVQTDVSASGASNLTSFAAYDLAGRVYQQVANYSAADSTKRFTTGIGYTSGGKIVTTTLPGTATKITEVYLDGQLKSVSGTGVVSESYTPFIDTGTGKKAIQSYFGGNGSAWTNTYFDWLGRKTEEWQPQWDGNNYGKIWYYNSSNQLYKFSQPGVADTLYVYDTLGVKMQEGLDINANGTLDLASDDRISQQNWALYTWDSGASWWKYTPTYTYASPGSATNTFTGYTLERLNPPSNYLSEKYYLDKFSNTSHEYTVVNRATKVATHCFHRPDSSVDSVQTIYNGLLVSSTDTANVTTTYGYDALGRAVTTHDPRMASGHDTTTAYVSGTGLVSTITDPAGVTQATYTYDSAGRVATVTNATPFNKVCRYEYTNRNEKYRVWGETDYPVEYAYNSSGQMTSMSTFRGGSSWNATTWAGVTTGSADTTTWTYNAATNLLASKTDAASKSVNYTYTIAQQVATRAWARTISGTPVTTTYSYSSTTGELTGVSYNDSTPSLTYTYNRLGQTATVADFTGTTRTFTYNLGGTLELQNEIVGTSSSDFYGDHRISRGYDTATGVIGRYNNLLVGNSSSIGADYSLTYGYDAYGRLNSALSGAFAYTYIPNSNLVDTVSLSAVNYTDTRTYESNHDWVASRTTNISSATKAAFAYAQDNLGRTTQVTKTSTGTSGTAAGLYSRYGNGTQGLTTKYDYDDRSQLKKEVTYVGTTATVLPGRNDSDYSYDPIGNRASVTHNGNTASYTTNSLNQYTARDVTGVFDVAGASTLTTITVSNGGSPDTAWRSGNYYFDGFALTNTSAPVFANLTITGSGGGSSSGTLAAYVAKTPEFTSTSYDADGNLLADGRWNYTYDAENRLLTMETIYDAYHTAGVTRQKLTFAYDYLGRRVSKLVQSGWTGSSYANTDYSERFLYDGWNLLYEFDATSSHNRIRAYVCGLDLSGTLQGAGGTGGVLAIWDYAISDWLLPVYDAMGNVHGLTTYGAVTLGGTSYSSGDLVAAYEYDAFGNTLRESGEYAASNPLRYSTKFTDIETALVYYGLRFYSPSQGRFINRDPIEEQGGLNLYAFCGNNSVNRWDYLGNVFVWDAFEINNQLLIEYANEQAKFNHNNQSDDLDREANAQMWANWGNANSGLGQGGSSIQQALNAQADVTGQNAQASMGHLTGLGGDTLDLLKNEPDMPAAKPSPPAASSPITYNGEISYKAAALVLAYGTFTGDVTSNTNPAQTYELTGRVDGVGLQIGLITGTAKVTYVTSTPQGMLGSNGGFWTADVGLGAGPLNILSTDITVNTHNNGSQAVFGEITPNWEGPNLSTDTTALNPADYIKKKPGIGFAAAFYGITVQAVTLKQPPPPPPPQRPPTPPSPAPSPTTR